VSWVRFYIYILPLTLFVYKLIHRWSAFISIMNQGRSPELTASPGALPFHVVAWFLSLYSLWFLFYFSSCFIYFLFLGKLYLFNRSNFDKKTLLLILMYYENHSRSRVRGIQEKDNKSESSNKTLLTGTRVLYGRTKNP